MNHRPHILPSRKRRPFWRPLALLGMVLWAVLQTVAHAETAPQTPTAGPKWGLDRMLSKAAPGLAKRMKEPKAAPSAAVDMNMGYPNYRYRGPIAQAKAQMLGTAAANVYQGGLNNNRGVVATQPRNPAPAVNPLAVRQAAIAPSAPAAAPNANAAAASSAADLVAEANALETQLQRQQQQQEQAAINLRVQRNALQAPENFNNNGAAANRLLASLQRAPSENQYRLDAQRRAQSDAAYVAQQRNYRGRVAASEELYPMAARGETDTGVTVSRAIRGSAQQVSPVQLQHYQVYVSDGYLNRHSEKSRQNTGDEPGGVYHVGTGRAASAESTTNNPFNNAPSANRRGKSSEYAEPPPYGE